MSRTVESIAQFGPKRALIGILTAPAAPDAGSPGDRTAVVVVNTGITHRPGHHRIFVQWAREMAEAGHHVLRFDLSGVGDSASVARPMDLLSAAQADLRDALDWMEAAGHRRIVLLGICSGADQGVAYAATDPRVLGVVAIDPTVPSLRSLRLELWRRLTRYTRPSAARRIPGMMLRQVRKVGRAAPAQTVLGGGPLATMPPMRVRPFLRDVYGAAVAHGVQFLAVFTSDTATRHGYRRMFADAFPDLHFDGNLRLCFLDGAHHLLVREQDRSLALDMVRDWLDSAAFGRSSPTP